MKLIKRTSAILLFTLLIAAKGVFAQAKGADAILGSFQTKNGESITQVYKQENQYFGKLTEGKGKNPAGTIVLKNLSYNNGSWTGKIYSLERNKDFDCTITLPDADTMKLVIKAGFMTKELVWTRVK